MNTTVTFERLYYGMPVYSISNEAGERVELPAGVEPEADSLDRLLADGWGTDADRTLIRARLLELAIEAKLAEIVAYDKSNAVDGFILDGAMAWIDRDTRIVADNRLDKEADAGREVSNLWLDTRCFKLPIPLAKKLLGIVEVYAADCFDVTASHKAAVVAMTDIESVRAYDHTVGYPDRPVINTTN